MSNVLIEETFMTDIADAIRSQLSVQTTYRPSEMAAAIGSISGGGGGLTYETGTWEPDSDIARGTITFSGTHSEPPILVALADATGTIDSTTYTNYVFCYFDYYRAFGYGHPYSTSAYRYALVSYVYRTTSTSSTSGATVQVTYNSDNTGSGSSTYSRYWATETGFNPYSNSTSRYWRTGRTYKWYAVWKA